MQFRLAEKQDLVKIIKMYKEVVKRLDANGIKIWDDSYPFAYFESDIENKQFYVLVDNKKIISAFALLKTHEGKNSMNWENKDSKAFYLNRFAVDSNYLKKGIGSLMVSKAKEVAEEKGADYLRLFVVTINKPAIKFYEKNGFRKVEGILNTYLADDTVLYEYGYEMEL
ncbi:MAG: GNAT family N-acetyltransferase [Bacilli bacterium]|jgi:ribosomal protein S18 acetylase RimI-like enzyme